jgi:uncharacterized membrane protein YgcG
MVDTAYKSVRELNLDLKNYRTVPQPDEIHAIQALILIKPDYFWALTDSLIDTGYLPTENIILLESQDTPPNFTVKEGNRRIAALKLILGHVPGDLFSIPDDIQTRINGLSEEWKTTNGTVPCTIFPASDALIVDRIVDRAHGKGEKAGRNQWTAVARARHNRDRNGTEPGLDLLEKYLQHGLNLTAQQAENWAGDYPVTVLDEAMPKIASRLGLQSAPDLAKKYPTVNYRTALESILLDIGQGKITFATIRDTSQDFILKYGIPVSAQGNTGGGTSHGGTGSSGGAGGATSQGGKGNAGSGGTGTGSGGKKPGAAPLNDPKTVKRLLRTLKPVGNRSKVVSLRDEMLNLKLADNPLAFCFLLRSMFEISAKAYCDDHAASGGPSTQKSNGREKPLADLLRDISTHLTNNGGDQIMAKKLYGATTELAKQDGILSVTSMNQLVHNPAFSITPSDICTMFTNVFPLLVAMNH